MHIDVKNYTYEEMPEYSDVIPGAHHIIMNKKELSLEYVPDIIYDEDNNLHLYMIMPGVFQEPDHRFPCIVYVQGSAWHKQRTQVKVPYLSALAKRGYMIAIVEYRDSSIAHFPCCIEDTKKAIRYLQNNRDTYHLTDDFIVAGDSSGGHTAAMTAVTANTGLFGGEVSIKGCIDLYGAVELTLEDGFPTTLNHQQADSYEGKYVGYDIRDHYQEAIKANVKTYAHDLNVPMLIAHGTKDRSVFCQQSVNLYEALKKEGKDVDLYLIDGADHGGAAFWSEEMITIYDDFIKTCFTKQ